MRRRSRFYGSVGKTKTLNNASAVDCKILAYYLYVICNYTLDFYPDNDEDGKYLGYIYILFSKLARKLKKEKEILEVLKKEVTNFEKRGLLVIGNYDTANENLHYDDGGIPYYYEEDKQIDRMRRLSLDNPSLMQVNMLRCFYASGSNRFLTNLIVNYLLRATPSTEDFSLDEMSSYFKNHLTNDKKFAFVKKAMNLTEMEFSMLQCTFRCSTNSLLTAILDIFSDTCKMEIYSRILKISIRDYNSLIRKDSKLRLYGFIDEEGKIEDDFFDCIEAGSMQPFFYDLLKEQNLSSCYSLKSFNVPDDTKNLMSKMLDSKENISLLLYGKPGSGKTEFAKALAKKSGLKAYIFKNERELYDDNKTNVLARLNCLLSMNSSDCVYIIDEADSLLRTCDFSFFGMLSPSPNKGTVNKMLEESKNKIIWIVNFTSQIDESTLRRFTYSYKFDSMTRSQLRSITETKLKPLALPSKVNCQILDLMERYKVTGASVDNVVKTIKSLGGADSLGFENQSDSCSEGLVQGIKSVLKENALLLNGKARMRESVSQNYDLRVLNASMSPEKIVKMVKNAKNFSESTNLAGDGQSGIRMLFYGVSGSGKTEFARYIAEELGSKILLKRASDILDKYVGESEKKIRDAFEEASRTDSILLFDEADTFFADRNNAEHSWERSQVNEFLTQMEEFPGILICTTNLKNIMDPAMNRRFHIITEFKPLNAEGINVMLNKYFPKLDFDGKEVSELEKMTSVTPGDFGVLASRIRFMDEEERTSEYVIKELCAIQKEKQGTEKTVGFCM